jgi:hypothetical protein
VPLVAVARDLQRAQRDQPSPSDRLFQIGSLLEARAQGVVHGHLEAGLARHQQALDANRQLQVELQQAEHVRDDGAGKAGLQLREIPAPLFR